MRFYSTLLLPLIVITENKLFSLQLRFVFTPPRNRGEVLFLLQFVCLCVFVSVCLSVCEQNADQTATMISTRSSLNSCLLQSLELF